MPDATAVGVARQTIFVREEQVKEFLTIKDALAAVEAAFREKGEGKAEMPPKLILDLPGGDFRAMPAYLKSTGLAGVKVANSHPGNPQKGLASVYATLILLEPDTGFPLAVIEATYLTGLRTGAAGALAAKLLARPDAEVVGLIGAGVQARFQLLGLKEVLPRLRTVKVFSKDPEPARRLKAELEENLRLPIQLMPSPQDAVRDADLIVTCTPSRQPIVMSEWVREGTHINAIGADAPGKQELDPALLKRARIFLDDLTQGMEAGEVNVAISQGLISKSDILGELADVLVGRLQGRTSPRDITLFSSTGLAIQDVAVGSALLRKLSQS